MLANPLFSTQLPEKFMLAPILQITHRLNYNEVDFERTSGIWTTHAGFQRYYRLMHIAADVEWLLSQAWHRR